MLHGASLLFHGFTTPAARKVAIRIPPHLSLSARNPIEYTDHTAKTCRYRQVFNARYLIMCYVGFDTIKTRRIKKTSPLSVEIFTDRGEVVA